MNNFNRAVIFGPIFICSCCSRQLYENGVTKITSAIEDKLEIKKPGFFHHCIPKKKYIEVTLNGIDTLSGFYICTTCKTSMMNGKVPAMATVNGLYLSNIEEDCQLTELENNLIAQNINFQYIFCLAKSRWGATKKQMISVPVSTETVRNTIQQLPRTPLNAGLIPVKLKRKMEYERSHRTEFVNHHKIFRALAYLKKSGNPYYQFYDDLITYEERCKEQDIDGHQLIFGDDEEQLVNEADMEPVQSDDDKKEHDEKLTLMTMAKMMKMMNIMPKQTQ